MKIKREDALEELYEQKNLVFTLDAWEKVRDIFIPLKHKEVKIHVPVLNDDRTGGEIRVELIKIPQYYKKKFKIKIEEEL